MLPLFLFLLSVVTYLAWHQPPAVFAALLLLVFSGPLVGQIAVAFTAPLFSRPMPLSFSALASVIGYLFVLESESARQVIPQLLSGKSTLAAVEVSALTGDLTMAGAVIAALALTFVALIEFPFYWIFREKRAGAVSWLNGMRPILLVFFLGFSIEQLGSYISSVLDVSVERIGLHE